MTQRLPRLPHRSQLRVQQLNMILRLIEHGSISAAAKDLNLTQSAVTKALQEVESLFGVMLFHREARGLRPTSYCEVVERFAHEVVIGLDETLEILGSRIAGEEGAVAIGVSPGQPQRLLAVAMSLFRARHPRLRVCLHEGSGPALLGLLDAGSIDFALMSMPARLDRERHAGVSLGWEPALAAVRPEHGLMRQVRRDLKSWSERAWAIPPVDDPLHDWLVSTWRQHALDLPADRIEADAGTALDLATGMDLICIASESRARPYLERGQLVVLPLPVALPNLPYGLVRRRRRPLLPGATLALRAIRDGTRSLRQPTSATGTAAL